MRQVIESCIIDIVVQSEVNARFVIQLEIGVYVRKGLLAYAQTVCYSVHE